MFSASYLEQKKKKCVVSVTLSRRSIFLPRVCDMCIIIKYFLCATFLVFYVCAWCAFFFFFVGCRGDLRRTEYEDLKKAKDKAEEDTIFSFKKKKGCQAERKQVPPYIWSLFTGADDTELYAAFQVLS